MTVVNKDPDKEIGLFVDLGRWITMPTDQVEAIILSGNSPNDFNDIGSENRVVPRKKVLKITEGRMAIPAHSLAIIKLRSQ